MSVRRPIGRNSVVTIANVPTAMEATASQADREVSGVAASASAQGEQGAFMGRFRNRLERLGGANSRKRYS